MLRLFLLILMSASSAIAESVVIGMDKEKVAITATFDGSQILLFGAVKRDKPAPLGEYSGYRYYCRAIRANFSP